MKSLMYIFVNIFHRERYNEKLDVYDFGVILLEIVTGRRINTKKDVKILKEQVL